MLEILIEGFLLCFAFNVTERGGVVFRVIRVPNHRYHFSIIFAAAIVVDLYSFHAEHSLYVIDRHRGIYTNLRVSQIAFSRFIDNRKIFCLYACPLVVVSTLFILLLDELIVLFY